MARVCEMCGKGPSSGNLVSHSQRKTRRRWLPNLQRAKLMIDGVQKSLKVCTRCLRSHKGGKLKA